MEEWIKQNKGFLTLLIFSVMWVSGAIWLLISEFITESFHHKDITLNELGDYLAGAFSPLAFLWLVYGYFMQNHELKNQISEFKSNSELQKKIYRDKYRALQPTLKIEKIKIEKIISRIDEFGGQEFENGSNYTLHLKNTGEEIFSVSIISNQIGKISSEIEVLGRDETKPLTTEITKESKGNKKINFSKSGNYNLYEINSKNNYLSYYDKEKRLLKQKIDFTFYESNKTDSDSDTDYLEAILDKEITSNDY